MVVCDAYKVSISLDYHSLELADVAVGKPILFSLHHQFSFEGCHKSVAESSGILAIDTSQGEFPIIPEKPKAQPQKRTASSIVNTVRPKNVRNCVFETVFIEYLDPFCDRK